MTKYRDNGAVGALLDEYEKSIRELSELLQTVNDDQLVKVVDHETEDQDCRSIQTIMTHVVSAGYNYSDNIRNKYVREVEYKKKELKNTIREYKSALIDMFAYAEKLFLENPNLPIEEGDIDNKMHVSWGQSYDIEQLMEHAIVHILRHRRQIERFLMKMQ
jgi:uncharacterized damage-inducible protein DinB|tara:strand:- start:4117 stop:4599 length:483 start_codon:yes stop_codon:yes gene_type:complete